MKITVIAGYYPPERTADARLNQELIESIVEKGETVTLIVPFPIRGVSEQTQKVYLERKYERVSNNLEIYRVGNPEKYKQGIVTRGISFFIKSYKIYQIAKKVESDICLVISTPPTLGYVAALLSSKKKVVYKLQDAFPDSLLYMNNLTESHVLILFLRKLEKWVYKSVTKIITVSDDLKQTLVKRGVEEEKIKVIYDWIDEKKCYPIEREDNILFSKFGINKNGFYITYAGNIGQLQNISTIVKAAEIVQKFKPEIGFIIIGDGSWKNELFRILQNKPHLNILCFPLQPVEDIAYIYSLGNIGLVSLKPGVTKIALPSKTWSIMAAGRAVLGEFDLYSGLCKIIDNNKVGYCVAPNDAQGMAERIITMYNNRHDTENMGVRGRLYIVNNLTRKVAMEQYMCLFENEINNQTKA